MERNPVHRARCSVCVKDCASGVLQAESGGDQLLLAYQTCLCRTCGPGEACEPTCPELELSRRENPREVTDARVPLVDGQIVRCSYNEQEFGTVRRLDDAAHRRPGQADIVTELCPACRREHFVLRLSDADRAP